MFEGDVPAAAQLRGHPGRSAASVRSDEDNVRWHWAFRDRLWQRPFATQLARRLTECHFSIETLEYKCFLSVCVSRQPLWAHEPQVAQATIYALSHVSGR